MAEDALIMPREMRCICCKYFEPLGFLDIEKQFPTASMPVERMKIYTCANDHSMFQGMPLFENKAACKHMVREKGL